MDEPAADIKRGEGEIRGRAAAASHAENQPRSSVRRRGI